ncbi:MAG: hypothetical protein H6744_20950 [Deltaproteobacteria bacterium]|nr:hypothetical protein [Deltaproteobacteria bacterium]
MSCQDSGSGPTGDTLIVVGGDEVPLEAADLQRGETPTDAEADLIDALGTEEMPVPSASCSPSGSGLESVRLDGWEKLVELHGERCQPYAVGMLKGGERVRIVVADDMGPTLPGWITLDPRGRVRKLVPMPTSSVGAPALLLPDVPGRWSILPADEVLTDACIESAFAWTEVPPCGIYIVVTHDTPSAFVDPHFAHPIASAEPLAQDMDGDGQNEPWFVPYWDLYDGVGPWSPNWSPSDPILGSPRRRQALDYPVGPIMIGLPAPAAEELYPVGLHYATYEGDSVKVRSADAAPVVRVRIQIWIDQVMAVDSGLTMKLGDFWEVGDVSWLSRAVLPRHPGPTPHVYHNVPTIFDWW